MVPGSRGFRISLEMSGLCGFFVHYVGNKFLHLDAKGFEFEPEITAKLLKAGYKIFEVPISTNPRGYKEGKKLDTVRDGIKAVRVIIKLWL